MVNYKSVYTSTFVIVLLFSLFFIACKEKETKTPVLLREYKIDESTTKEENDLETIPSQPINDPFVNIDTEKFSDILSSSDKEDLDIYLPISRIEKYTNLGEEYYAVFTEDKAIKSNPDFPNSRINFYLLKKLNNEEAENSNNKYKIINKFSKNSSIYNKYEVQYTFLHNQCVFKDLDENGSIEPIIINESKYKRGFETDLHIFTEEKDIYLNIHNGEGTYHASISPYFYTLPYSIQNQIKQIVAELQLFNFDPDDEYENNILIEEFWNNKTCYWDGKLVNVYKGSPVTNYVVSDSLTAESYSLEELKAIYESLFPTSQDISIDFGVLINLKLHSGQIINNLNKEVVLPSAQYDYIYVSENNKIFKHNIFSNYWLPLEIDSGAPFDDNNIQYNFIDGYHAISWDYQNGWESENLQLFPKNMPEGKYVAYAKLSYFDGEQEQALFSEKEIINYLKPENITKDKILLNLKVKYDSIYPVSTDLKVDTGIKLSKTYGSLNEYEYVPHIKNVSDFPIDTNKSTFIFYFINNKDEVIKRVVSDAFLNVLEPDEGDILGDYYFVNIVDDFWFDDNVLFNPPIVKGLKKGEYLMYSELITNEGISYYSKKEFIEFKSRYKSQQTDALYQSPEEFEKDLSEYIVGKGYAENYTNCFERKSEDNMFNITTCYYPKQMNNNQLYSILKYTNGNMDQKLIEYLPKKDTIYLTKHSDKIRFNIPKNETDTLKIKVNTTDYYIYKKDDFPVLEKYYPLK